MASKVPHRTARPKRLRLPRILAIGLLAGGFAALAHAQSQYAVLAWNDLGMHCMNSDFSEIMVLPPFNTLHAQVLRRGIEPDLIIDGVTVRYVIPRNTHSADKSNFWKFPQPVFGPPPPPNVGLTGVRNFGTLNPTTAQDWDVVGIPIVPTDDLGRESPYNLTTVTVLQGTNVLARTQTVVPTSPEMSCNLCHNMLGVSTATDILTRHDKLHGTNLLAMKPVLCANCHGSNALGLAGDPNLPNLSRAMHGAHAGRMTPVSYLPEVCYACHPGVRTQCQRDVHFSAGTTCSTCHVSMTALADPARRPWLDEPRCGSCHVRAGFEFEQPGVLYRNSIGHGGVHCAACHSSPHAITPTATAIDNVQANLKQGHSGVIDTCTVCHTTPPGSFFHSYQP
jgi:hypothetical protein